MPSFTFSGSGGGTSGGGGFHQMRMVVDKHFCLCCKKANLAVERPAHYDATDVILKAQPPRGWTVIERKAGDGRKFLGVICPGCRDAQTERERKPRTQDRAG